MEQRLIDQIILYLASNNRAFRWELVKLLNTEFGCKKHRRGHLFSKSIGHTSDGFNPNLGTKNQKTTYWYRTKKGVYGLNLNGYKRYQELVCQTNETLK